MATAFAAQNGPKSMSFEDYSLLVVFDAYLRSQCTTSDVYTCNCAGLIVIRSLRTALGLSKEEERKKERKKERRKKMNNSRGRRFQFTTLEMSVSFAKGIFMLRTIV